MGVTLSLELFQDPRDVAVFILGVRNVYLGRFPAGAHGDDESGINGISRFWSQTVSADQDGRMIRPLHPRAG